MPYLHQARCLDVYAGTGALGLESLSRGAQFVQFVELNKSNSQLLKRNLLSLDAQANEFAIEEGDALNFL
jgi:16S rRNA (guanine966-N2)-methyltransferase